MENTAENNNLTNNLKIIAKYNTKLAEKILNHIQINAEFEFIEAKSGDIVLSYKNKALHSITDPQEEALNIFKNLSHDEKTTINVIFGLGLGYLFKRFTMNVKGRIVVYEPNIDVLRITLETADLTAELSRPGVFIVDSIKDIEKFYEHLYVDEAELTLSFTRPYTEMYPKVFDKLIDELGFMRGLYTCNYKNLFEKSRHWTLKGIINTYQTLRAYDLEYLRNKFTNKPAVIISAGPSLDKNIHQLKEFQDKAVIFSVGTSTKTAVKHGIKPDFLTIVEYNDCASQVEGLDLSDINLILHPSANKKFHKLKAKKRFTYYPNNDFFSKWLAQKMGIDITDYENKGTVSLCALFSAIIMGCSPIILIGQDLAYVDGKCYSKDSAYKDLVCVKDPKTGMYKVGPVDEENYIKSLGIDKSIAQKYTEERFKELTESIYMVKGQNGEMLPTDPGYATFIKYFEDLAEQKGNDIKFINSTEGGAYLKGFEHIPLADALNQNTIEVFDVEAVIKDVPVFNDKNLRHKASLEKIKTIRKSYTETLEIISGELKIFEDGKNLVARFSRLAKMNRIYDSNFGKYLKESLLNFAQIEQRLINKDMLVMGALISEHYKLSRFVHANSENVNQESMKELASLLSDFYIKTGYEKLYELYNTLKNVNKILDDGIKILEGKLDESCYTKG